jgi:hypothetical protein
MSRFFRSFTSFFGFAFDLLVDGLRFLRLTVRSHSALGAEILFLRKQLAFYEERETPPRRLNDSARLSLVFWSRLFRLEERFGDRQAGDSCRLAPQGLSDDAQRLQKSSARIANPDRLNSLHEKAGTSQDGFLFTFFALEPSRLCRHPSIRTL